MNSLMFCLALCSLANSAQAKCVVRSSDFRTVQAPNDTFYDLLKGLEKCPESVQVLKELVKNAGFSVSPATVANRGRHTPQLGSFSFFEHEQNKGEFFFGHFTKVQAGAVSLDQKPSPGKLLIEVIAWDRQKQWFNFYELKRLRCSGCHTSGGPIMKELAEPHNDWRKLNRPLSLHPNQASQEMQQWISSVVDANELSHSVLLGINKLEHSLAYQELKGQLSLQEQLRPLFCAMEINLESDISPLGTSSTIQMAIQSLLKHGVVSEDYVQKVLSYDSENPLFSEKRCALLKQVPFDVEKLKEQSSLIHSNSQSMFKKLIQIRMQVFNNEISQNPLGQILEPGFRVIFLEAG